MNLSSPFIYRPVMTTFVILAMIIAGGLAFFKLPVNDLPTIEHPHIQVSTGYPGANPTTILNQVTIPLEKELGHVKGVQEMNSTSSSGFSSISLQLDFDKKIDEAIRDVQNAIQRAKTHLPKDLDPSPSYQLQEDSQEPIIYLLLTSEQAAISEMRTYADTYIIPKLNRIEGVAQTIVFGSEKSIWIRLNPELMAAKGVGFNNVIDSIQQHTMQIPLGTIQASHKRLSIELPQHIERAKDLENIKIGNTEIRIKDIGEVSDKSDYDKDIHFVTQNKTTPALILGVKKVSDGNSIAISNQVHKAIKTIRDELPKSIQLNVWFDKADWIKESLHDVQWSLIIAFLLVMLVIYLSLGRVRESLITSVALPLSIVATFAIMYIANFSIDILSLLALTLSVGFVVDDAIVMLENIVRFQEKGESPLEASLKGSKQISFTILSMTLSLIAVFIPILFMSGMNGRIFREFSLTLAFAILVSGFVSLTVIPMLCSRYLSSQPKHSILQKMIDALNAWMVNIYGKTLRKVFHFPKSIFLFACLCIGLTVFLFAKLPVNLFPPEDRGYIFAFMGMPTGMKPADLTEKQNQIELLIQQNSNIEKFLNINHEGNLIFIMQLKSIDQRPPQSQVIAEVQQTLSEIPGLQPFIQGMQLINLDVNFGQPGQYQLVVQGLNFDDIELAANDLAKSLQFSPEISFAQNSLKSDSLLLVMNIQEDLTHKAGFKKEQIQKLLQDAYGQSSIGFIQKETIKEKIYMELLSKYQNHSDAPSKLYLTSENGTAVPFKTLVQWKEKPAPLNLTQREQMPSAMIHFSLAEKIPSNIGLQKVESIMREALPSNVNGKLIGSAKIVSSAINETLLLLLAAAVVMYIVLGILYESFIHPLTILSSIPFAGLGGVLTLLIFNQPLSIFSAVGFLLLIGIVKKNGIMMVDYALEAQRGGMLPEQAIYEACLVRFRPIMMTTIAAIMGAIPLAIGLGDSAAMRKGLGLVVTGGLLFSQILTLYVTPIIYLTFSKLFTKKEKYSKGVCTP